MSLSVRPHAYLSKLAKRSAEMDDKPINRREEYARLFDVHRDSAQTKLGQLRWG